MEKRKIKYIILFFIIIFPGIIFLIIKSFSNNFDVVRFDNDEMFYTCPDISGASKVISKNDYNIEYITEIIGYRSNIFPIIISDSNEYFCFAEKCFSEAGWIYCSEIYLKCTYDVAHYNTELERLLELESYGDKLIKSQDLFSLPSLIGVYNYKATFEYCLLDYDNLSISYIYFRGIDKIDNLVFDVNYIPSKRLKDTDFPKNKIKDGYYNMY